MRSRDNNSYRNNSAAERSHSASYSRTSRQAANRSNNRVSAARGTVNYISNKNSSGAFGGSYTSGMARRGGYGSYSSYGSLGTSYQRNNNTAYSQKSGYTGMRANIQGAYRSAGYRSQGSYRGSRGSAQYGFGGNIQYNNTSEAYDFDYAAEAPATRVRRIVRRSYTRVREAEPLSLYKTFATVAVVFVMVLVFLSFWAVNNSKRDAIVNMQDELALLQNDIKFIDDNITKNIDLNKIKSEALKLGLQEPAEYQVMKINVPKDSYTVQYGTQESKRYSLWEAFKNIFKD